MDTARDRMPSLLVVKFREKKYRFKLPWWYGWKWFVGGLIAADAMTTSRFPMSWVMTAPMA
jgi:hypothetical protein